MLEIDGIRRALQTRHWETLDNDLIAAGEAVAGSAGALAALTGRLRDLGADDDVSVSSLPALAQALQRIADMRAQLAADEASADLLGEAFAGAATDRALVKKASDFLEALGHVGLPDALFSWVLSSGRRDVYGELSAWLERVAGCQAD